MERKELNYKGKKIVYRTKGEGDIVVLLHGFGEDGNIWKEQFSIFPHHQLIIPDLPGSGESEMIEDMSMEGLAEVVKVIIETPDPLKGGTRTQPSPARETAENTVSSQSGVSAVALPTPLGAGRGGVSLIGHSMGGYITLAFAEKYPQQLNAFGLFHSTAFADTEEKRETRRKGIDFINQHGAAEFLKTTIPNLYAPLTKEKKPELIEAHIAATRNFSGEALVSYYEAMMNRPDRTNVLKAAGVPVLFVMGRHDTAVPLADGLKQCHLPSLSHIHILEGSGHSGMVEEAETSNTILKQFIDTMEKSIYT